MRSNRRNEGRKAYFQAQRQNPTVNYTEFVVRTYYLIYQACGGDFKVAIPKQSLDVRRMSYAVYDGIYDKPDHGYSQVISSCLKDLERAGYLRIQQRDGCEYISVEKPLDFLLEGEHEIYCNRFGIGKASSKGAAVVSLQPICSRDEFKETLEGILHPENNPGIPPQERTSRRKQRLNTHCEACGGYYVHRYSKYGPFFGCSNYPDCRNTKTIAGLSYMILQQKGIDIYEDSHVCWKCGRMIKLHSYFPQIDFYLADPVFSKLYDLSVVRLSVADTLDAYLSQKYKNIQMRYSKKAGFSYMANTCPHCGSLQGSQMSLSGMFDNLLKEAEAGKIGNYVAEHITDMKLLPEKEWQLIVDAVMERE